ncbi:hypothetical protein MKW98_011255 [Papaver atlanticum]|uniref:Pre-rRNA-processing protein TSR2 homolog n=1 Tax=Papaver atlanticum TaxID=357466 RepID=A0AAD4SVL5_9MAGN|nr:hypothetical protein MKW98_011255 [Papaver atlanticum]
MGSDIGNGKKLTLALVEEGIRLILSQWTALQLALQYRSYDRFSCQKAEQLRADIFSWFIQSKELYIDDLEDILEESMSLSFDTDVADESIEEVALHLMIMHEECLQGKFESIEKLRVASNGSKAVSQSTLVVNEDDDSNDNDLISESAEMLVDDLKESKTVEVEEGWCVVAAKKSKARGCSSSKRISS